MNTKKHKKNRIKRKSRVKNRIILVLFVMIAVVFSGYGYIISNISIFGNGIDKDRDVDAQKVKNGEPVNILILGADFVKNDNESMDKRRTDAIMVANYNPKTKKVVAVSIPRDTRVKSNGKDVKINSINKEGGPVKVVDTLKNLLGIDINYYFLLDYNGFNKIIDAIGGVPITVPYKMKYDDDIQNLHIDFKEGEELVLDGKKAEEFFRWRENNSDEEVAQTIDFGGDLGRIQNQKYFLNALIDKVTTPSILAKVPEIIKIASEYINTNMGEEILAYGKAIAKLGTSNIEFITLRGEVPEENNPNWYFNYQSGKNQDILEALKGGSFFNRESKNITIINGTVVNGLATKFKNELIDKEGYSDGNIKTETNHQGIEESVIEVYDIDETYDNIIKEDFAFTGIEKIQHKEGSNDYDSNIIIKIGTDRNS